jgi:hypothetical protein
MFSIKKKKLKKKLKKDIIFIKGIKRVVLVLNFLKFLIFLNTKRYKKNMNIKLFLPIFFFLTKNNNNNIDKIKLKIYKIKLASMQI